MNARRAKAAGSGFAFLGVLAGAFGTHLLRDRIPADRMAIYQTGVLYHLVHALGILLLAALMNTTESGKALPRAAILFCAGIILFSGSLYALAISGERWLGAITPLGGVCFLVGWAIVFLAASTRSN